MCEYCVLWQSKSLFLQHFVVWSTSRAVDVTVSLSIVNFTSLLLSSVFISIFIISSNEWHKDSNKIGLHFNYNCFLVIYLILCKRDILRERLTDIFTKWLFISDIQYSAFPYENILKLVFRNP